MSRFQTLFWCFYCWLWISKCQLDHNAFWGTEKSCQNKLEPKINLNPAPLPAQMLNGSLVMNNGIRATFVWQYVCKSVILKIWGLTFPYEGWHLAALKPTLGHCHGDILIHPMLILVLRQVQPEGQQEPRKKSGFLSPTKCKVQFKRSHCQFWI